MTFAVPPDPGAARTLDDLVEGLRALKVWAGDPSYDAITDRINRDWRAAGRPAGELARRTTVADCFKIGRRRLNTDLVLAVVRALHADPGYVTQWRQALRVVDGTAAAATQVRVQDRLPQALAGFTGRAAELSLLRRAARARGSCAISAIDGMAGVGKTQLAVRAGHLVAADTTFEQVLFVNLRGFHPDPAQPPADPSAVLDGFLRLLGVADQQIPHDLTGRVALYRRRLAGRRALIVLDNAVDPAQVRPLLPDRPGAVVLITSRRSLADLAVTHLTVDVFSPAEAAEFLAVTVPDVPVGADPDAAARIGRRCGHLPLALGLLAGHVRRSSGWTLSDYADRLDERQREHRAHAGVTLALDVSYGHLSADHRRLLRSAALHPGQSFDAYAAAALTDRDLPTARALLEDLHRDHLLQRVGPGRYAFHDLIQAYAANRAADEDPPPARRAALTRLFDNYLAASAAAVDTLYPVEAQQRPRVAPPSTPVPELSDPAAAVAWLDAERPALVALAAHTADHGWRSHAVRFSIILYRYLDGGYPLDALDIHGHALTAAREGDDVAGQAHALNGIGTAHLRMGRYGAAAEHLRRALPLFRRVGDLSGQARILNLLGNIEKRLGRYQRAADLYEQALHLFRQAGDRAGAARALRNLGVAETRLGRFDPAVARMQRAWALCREIGDRTGEADVLGSLGEAESRLGRYETAADHVRRCIDLYRELGDRLGVMAALDELGALLTRLGRPGEAVLCHREALDFYTEVADLDGQCWCRNGLGEAAVAAGRPAEAVGHHETAHAVAAAIGSRDQQARAHTGLGRAHRALGDVPRSRRHLRRAIDLYAELGMPEVAGVRAALADLDGDPGRAA